MEYFQHLNKSGFWCPCVFRSVTLGHFLGQKLLLVLIRHFGWLLWRDHVAELEASRVSVSFVRGGNSFCKQNIFCLFFCLCVNPVVSTLTAQHLKISYRHRVGFFFLVIITFINRVLTFTPLVRNTDVDQMSSAWMVLDGFIGSFSDISIIWLIILGSHFFLHPCPGRLAKVSCPLYFYWGQRNMMLRADGLKAFIFKDTKPPSSFLFPLNQPNASCKDNYDQKLKHDYNVKIICLFNNKSVCATLAYCCKTNNKLGMHDIGWY